MNMHVTPSAVARIRLIHSSRKPTLSALEWAIAEHKKATRLWRNREADLQKIYDAHPDLDGGSPLILFYTRSDGTKCYGRCEYDYNKVFPTSIDHISPGNVAGRKRFLAELKAARPAFERQQRKVGIPRAINLTYEAHQLERRAFERFVKVVPTGRAELRRYTRYLFTAVTNRVGGQFTWNIPASYLKKEGISWEQYKGRQHYAFRDLYTAVRSLATRA